MSFIKISVGLYIAYFAKNNKKIIFGYCSLIKLLFICMFALFMSHEQWKRHWTYKKKKNQKRNTNANPNRA